MTNLNIDLGVEYVKDLVNNSKCVTCDCLNAVYIRYTCGHFLCQNCITTAEECLLCLTPPFETKHFVDKPLSLRTEHISNLLTTFQDLFNVDVFRRQRISDQLKVEKQVFPECIQAPSKYCNKRKSTFNSLVKGKENIIPAYPGENISSSKVFKMENKNVYVKKWLDTNLQCQKKHRKAFTDLGVNRNLSEESLAGLAGHNIHKSYNSKRKIIETFNNENENMNKLSIKHKKLKKKVNPQTKLHILPKINKNENDESGIVIDENVIEIDESQNDHIDKDMLACQAVKEAEKYIHISKDNNTTQTSSVSFKDIQIITKPNFQSIVPLYKVPFYKRSSLYETCNLCKIYEKASDFKPVTIIIDSKHFVTTMNISDCREDNCHYMHKQSIGIQTDDTIQNINISSSLKSENEQYRENANIKNIQENILISNSLKVKGIIVSESEADSDTDDERVNTLETIADVHSNAPQAFEVLAPLEPLHHENRLKRKVARDTSPLSTDSSDKENYDPNRAKRQKFNKKLKK